MERKENASSMRMCPQKSHSGSGSSNVVYLGTNENIVAAKASDLGLRKRPR